MESVDRENVSAQLEADGSVGPDPERKAQAWVLVLLALILILHPVAYFVLPGWLWGADALFPMAASGALGLTALGLVLLLSKVTGRLCDVLERIWSAIPWGPLADRVIVTVFVGALGLFLFWGLGSRDPVGGAWLFHAPYRLSPALAGGSMPLLPSLLERLARSAADGFGLHRIQSVRGLSVVFGVVFVSALALLPWGRWGFRRGFPVALAVGVSGVSLIFLSPRADLGFEALAAGAFLALGLLSIAGGLKPLVPAAVAWSGAVVHPLGLALIPPWAAMVGWRGDRFNLRAFAVALAGLSAAVGAGLVALDAVFGDVLSGYGSDLRWLWASGSGTRAAWVVERLLGGASGGSAIAFAGWALERIWGWVNGLLLVAPAGAALAVVAAFRLRRMPPAPELKFLAVATATTAAVALAAAPHAGPPREWGVYGPAGMATVFFGLWWLRASFEGRPAYRTVLAGVLAISLIHFVPPLLSARQPNLEAEKLSLRVTASSPWDVRGRASALEGLAVFYLSRGDTLAAADRLSDAWQLRPDPLYLGAAAVHYTAVGRYDLAQRRFSTLLETRPRDVEAHLSVGILLMVKGDFKGAERHFMLAYGDTTVHLTPPEVDVFKLSEMPEGPERDELKKRIGELRRDATETFVAAQDASLMGNLLEAERGYKRALEIYPRWGKMQYEVHCHLGTIYSMERRFREAAYEFLQAIAAYREYPLCYYVINGIGYGPARRSAVAHEVIRPGERE